MSTLHTNDKSMLAATSLVFVGAIAYGIAYDGLLLPLLLGGLLLGASFVVASLSQGRTLSMVGLTALGMAMVALLIHVARGRAEAHFAVFAFLAVTPVYRHWLPVIAGAATIAVHHLSFNFF